MLVTYSDSEEETIEETTNENEVAKKNTLPPLPDFINNLYKEKVKVKDNPSMHQGRIRSAPHVEGNWACFVFIKIPLQEKYKKWYTKLEVKSKQLIQSMYGKEARLEPCIKEGVDSFTLSLSKTVFFKYNQLKELKDRLKLAFSGNRKFFIKFSNLTHFSNEEESRYFLSLECDKETNTQLKANLKKVDNIIASFNKPTFYDPPRFHTSLLWCLPPTKINEQFVNKLLKDGDLEYELDKIQFYINKISYKIGHNIYDINLK